MTATADEQSLAAARDYEALFVPALFEPWAELVLEGAKIEPGHHVLDIACGTGVLARAALDLVGPAGRVTGADPSPGMLATAQHIEPQIDWRQCPAEALAIENDSVDRAVSQFGLMFFDDHQQAADEIFRVLKPGGRLALAAWRSIESNPVYDQVARILDKHVSTAAGDAIRLPFSLGDAALFADLLHNSGFAQVTTHALTAEACFPSIRHLVEAELRGWLPVFDIHLSEAEIEAVLQRSESELAEYMSPNGEAVFPTKANLYLAS